MKKESDNLINSIFEKLENIKTRKITLEKDEFVKFLFFLIKNKK